MKKAMLKLLSVLLIACVVLQCAPVAAFAATEEETQVISEVHTEEVVPDTDLPGNEELFAVYVEQKLYDREWATFGTAARENLNDIEKAIYDQLKTNIEAVAASGGSAAFALSEVTGLQTEWTAEELGVESIEDVSAAQAAFTAQFDTDRIISALLADCPYDLYWYDKTKGASMTYSMSRSGMSSGGTTYWTKATVKDITFTFQVASGYQDGNTTTVTSEVAKVSTAKTNAQTIANTYASKSDYEKLVGYKTEICDLVSYNDEAAADDYTGGYGDPWQLIYVFDGDESTEVVCEGYAKAFQYLCDLGGLDCISVSGVMAGGTGAGGHMWNIVTLDGQNYLVDVTNCDEGTIGAPDALFLVGNADGSVAEGYTFTISSQDIVFTYDADILDTWTEAELTLAAENYDPSASTECAHTGGTATCQAKAVCEICGEEYGDLGDHTIENGVCTVCGTAAGVAHNTATNTSYETLKEALEAAQEGQTVLLLKDLTEDTVMVSPGITLDLNGCELTASYVVGFDTAHVVDNVGTGRLVTGMQNVVLDEENAMVPVYKEDAYIFAKVGFAIKQDESYTGEGIKINALVCPVNMAVVELLKDGGADNNLQIVILLSWGTEEGAGSQEFVFTDQVVSDVYSSNTGTWDSYGKMFSMVITGFENIENLKANVVITSDTNVELISTNSVAIGDSTLSE